MSNYDSVKAELDRGTPAELLCATCPWDRLCITPPQMTSDQVKKKIDEAAPAANMADPRKADEAFSRGLLSVMLYAGKDTQAQVCPVFAMRLSSLDGRSIADSVRAQMRDWAVA